MAKAPICLDQLKVALPAALGGRQVTLQGSIRLKMLEFSPFDWETKTSLTHFRAFVAQWELGRGGRGGGERPEGQTGHWDGESRRGGRGQRDMCGVSCTQTGFYLVLLCPHPVRIVGAGSSWPLPCSPAPSPCHRRGPQSVEGLQLPGIL